MYLIQIGNESTFPRPPLVSMKSKIMKVLIDWANCSSFVITPQKYPYAFIVRFMTQANNTNMIQLSNDWSILRPQKTMQTNDTG